MALGYPETPRSFANQFASNTLSATSTVVGGSTYPSLLSLGFNFNAALIKFVVDTGTVYINLTTTGAATTNDYKVTSGDLMQDFYDVGCGIAGMAIAATTTAPTFRVGAWG